MRGRSSRDDDYSRRAIGGDEGYQPERDAAEKPESGLEPASGPSQKGAWWSTPVAVTRVVGAGRDGLSQSPLRARHAEGYFDSGLALLEEIQRTGDIFFPLNWLNSLLDGHQSATAAGKVETFLSPNPDLPHRLRSGKLLQAADGLFALAE